MPSLPRLVRHAHYRCCEKAISPTTPTLLQDMSDMRFQKLGECLPMPPMPGRQSTLEKASAWSEIIKHSGTLPPNPALEKSPTDNSICIAIGTAVELYALSRTFSRT